VILTPHPALAGTVSLSESPQKPFLCEFVVQTWRRIHGLSDTEPGKLVFSLSSWLWSPSLPGCRNLGTLGTGVLYCAQSRNSVPSVLGASLKAEGQA
jgi:hypothetical protein